MPNSEQMPIYAGPGGGFADESKFFKDLVERLKKGPVVLTDWVLGPFEVIDRGEIDNGK